MVVTSSSEFPVLFEPPRTITLDELNHTARRPIGGRPSKAEEILGGPGERHNGPSGASAASVIYRPSGAYRPSDAYDASGEYSATGEYGASGGYRASGVYETGLKATESHLSVHSNAPAKNHAAEPRHPRDGWPRWKFPAFFVLLCLSMVVYGYDLSNIANVQAPIYEAFGNIKLLPWAATGYTLMNASLVLIIRKISYVFPMKYQYLVYVLLIIVGSSVAGSASTMVTMIIGRCITGIGGAGTYQLGVVYNTLFTTPTEQSRLGGLIMAFWALGLFLGPIVGGAFTANERATWRWAFYISIPFNVIMLVLGYLCLPLLNLVPQLSVKAKLAGIDWVGCVLHVSGFVLLACSLIFSGSTWPWHSGSAIASWSITGVIFVVYIRQQAFSYFTTPERRVFPVELIQNYSICLISLCTIGSGASYAFVLLYTPLFFAFGLANSPVQAGVHLLPFVGLYIFSVLAFGALMPKLRMYSPFYITSGVLVLIGGMLQTLITIESSTARILGVSCMIGAGIGLSFTVGMALTVRLVPKERGLDCVGLGITCQLFGVVLAQGISAAVYQNVGFDLLRAAVPDAHLTSEQIRQLLAGVDSTALDLLSSSQVQAVVLAVTTILARLYYIVAAGGAVILIFGTQMKFEKLNYELPKPETSEA